jgi:isopenicillin N synthase-like dioxygenase
MPDQIPAIDVAALFEPPAPARDAADRAIFAAASGIGFMTIHGFPGAELLTAPRRAGLLKVFALPEAEKAKLLRWNFDPSKSNYYRGWFPLQPTAVSYKEGIDMGPDIAHADAAHDPTDPLLEKTPLPAETALPGWRAGAATYYRAMEAVGAALMASVARGLGLPDATFDGHFRGGISTLRLIRYPQRQMDAGVDLTAEAYWVTHQGRRRLIIGREHADSGFVTLLAQDGVEGLQAKNHAGAWIDVPPADGMLAVNFGKLLERWTGGIVQATPHRVIAPGRERFSIPFFYEPRADALIAPLPDGRDFAPFLYGDYLWDTATRFVEMAGVRDLRTPRMASATA